MTAAGGSHIGLRKDNEDSYYISENNKLLAIADGMGGHEHGQLASRIAVEQFVRMAEKQSRESVSAFSAGFSTEQMQAAFEQANRAVYEKQEALHSGIMGTTLTAVCISGNALYAGHVGDSRLYLLRDGELTQLTMDHTYYAELLRQGNLDIPLENRQKHVLLKALGPEKQVDGQFLEEALYTGDILLLCTDGLYNAVQEAQMLQIMQNNALEEAPAKALDKAVHQMIGLALEQGASDNITVIIYRHE